MRRCGIQLWGSTPWTTGSQPVRWPTSALCDVGRTDVACCGTRAEDHGVCVVVLRDSICLPVLRCFDQRPAQPGKPASSLVWRCPVLTHSVWCHQGVELTAGMNMMALYESRHLWSAASALAMRCLALTQLPGDQDVPVGCFYPHPAGNLRGLPTSELCDFWF
eukprot:3754391-Rhodomonas_salina.1